MKYVFEKAKRSGADEVIIRDCRKEFLESYCFPMLRARAVYDGDYMLGTAVARPLIAREQVDGGARTRRRRGGSWRHRQRQRSGQI